MAEVLRAYLRFLAAQKAQHEDLAVWQLLEQHVPSTELLELAFCVAGAFVKGQARKAYAVALLVQWALRGLEVGV